MTPEQQTEIDDWARAQVAATRRADVGDGADCECDRCENERGWRQHQIRTIREDGFE